MKQLVDPEAYCVSGSFWSRNFPGELTIDVTDITPTHIFHKMIIIIIRTYKRETIYLIWVTRSSCSNVMFTLGFIFTDYHRITHNVHNVLFLLGYTDLNSLS